MLFCPSFCTFCILGLNKEHRKPCHTKSNKTQESKRDQSSMSWFSCCLQELGPSIQGRRTYWSTLLGTSPLTTSATTQRVIMVRLWWVQWHSIWNISNINLQVKIVFRRKWFYHLITIFIQSVLLLGVAYMTFYFRINNFQVLFVNTESRGLLFRSFW